MIRNHRSCDCHFKILDGNQKIILKQIVHRHLPEFIMVKPGMGFGVHLLNWMRNDLKSLFIDLMDDHKLEMSGMRTVKLVQEIRDVYLAGSLENFERI